jgi:hypothetical protein
MFMEKYMDIMQRTVELSESCLEGIHHIEKRLLEGQYEGTVFMLRDVLEAYYQLEKSTEIFVDSLPTNKLETLTDKLRVVFEKTVKGYEDDNYDSALKLIQTKLLPAYLKWQKELGRCTRSILVS